MFYNLIQKGSLVGIINKYNGNIPRCRFEQQNHRLGTVSNELLRGLNMFYGTNLTLSY